MNISRPGEEASPDDNDGSCTRNYGAAMIPLDDSFEPGDYDVLCGRGKKCYASVGNDRFRKLVESKLEEYSAARTKIQKTNIVTQVLHEVRKRSPKGGFVKKDPATGKWFEVGDFVAREKSTQAFRDALHDRYRSSNHSKKKRRKEELTRAKRPPRGPSSSSEGSTINQNQPQNSPAVPSLMSSPPMVPAFLSTGTQLTRDTTNPNSVPSMRLDGAYGGGQSAPFRRLSGQNDSISVPPLPSPTDFANYSASANTTWTNDALSSSSTSRRGSCHAPMTLQQRLDLAQQLISGQGARNCDSETLRQRLDLAQQLVSGHGNSNAGLNVNNDLFQQLSPDAAYRSSSSTNTMLPQNMAAQLQQQRSSTAALDSGAQAVYAGLSFNLGGNGTVMRRQSYSAITQGAALQNLDNSMGLAVPSNHNIGALVTSNSAMMPDQNSSSSNPGSMANAASMWTNQNGSRAGLNTVVNSSTSTRNGVGYSSVTGNQEENPFEPVPLAEDVSLRHEARQQWGSGNYAI